MVDWVHCNTCFHQPGDGRKFHVTTCGHIYCEECVSKSTKEKCAMCNSKCSTMQLSSKMKSDVDVYFTDPVDLMAKQHKQLLRVMQFQKDHRQRLTLYNREKLAKQTIALQKTQKSVELERDVIVLKEENGYLKKLVQRYESMGLSQQAASARLGMAGGGRPMSAGSSPGTAHGRQAFSPTYSSKSSTSPYKVIKTQTSKSPYHSDHPPSSRGPSQHKTPTMISSGRLTVRTPPSGGKIGVIPGTPSPQDRLTMRAGHTPGRVEAAMPIGATSSRGSPMNTSPVQSQASHSARPLTPGSGIVQHHRGSIPMTPVSTAPLTMFATPTSQVVTSSQTSKSPWDKQKRMIQLNYSQQSNVGSRLVPRGKHDVCVEKIQQLKSENKQLQSQNLALKTQLQKQVETECKSRERLEETIQEIHALKKLMDMEGYTERDVVVLKRELEEVNKSKVVMQQTLENEIQTLKAEREDQQKRLEDQSLTISQLQQQLTTLKQDSVMKEDNIQILNTKLFEKENERKLLAQERVCLMENLKREKSQFLEKEQKLMVQVKTLQEDGEILKRKYEERYKKKQDELANTISHTKQLEKELFGLKMIYCKTPQRQGTAVKDKLAKPPGSGVKGVTTPSKLVDKTPVIPKTATVCTPRVLKTPGHYLFLKSTGRKRKFDIVLQQSPFGTNHKKQNSSSVSSDADSGIDWME